MHHVALDGTGPDNGHLDHQIIEHPGPETRQHGHLRPALDLEHPDRVGLPDHGVSSRVLGRDGLQRVMLPLVVGQKVQPLLHAGQHAQRQHIDLHEFQDVDIVLVPFDDLAIVHGRRFDWHQFVQPVIGQDKPAGMLRQVTRHANQAARQIQRQPDAPVGQVDPRLIQRALIQLPPPAPDLAGQGADQVFGQAHDLADIAQRALRTIARNHGRKGCVVAAIMTINPLDDLLPARMLEIHVDIRRLAALFGDKPLKQQRRPCRIDGGNAQHVADSGIGRRSPPLAQDAL
ncbi:hypothetical protein KOEU_33620 [Komagataeibacter europaeus]|uniref:Uncharacterized protein n=1 Tax=Komagataeibacter europaeus TaxID=33995 RepID=A0A0M0ED08_KOMEU|nr:hypothetical protein KOEU_33620 [Komagataeibacter europaeus]